MSSRRSARFAIGGPSSRLRTAAARWVAITNSEPFTTSDGCSRPIPGAASSVGTRGTTNRLLKGSCRSDWQSITNPPPCDMLWTSNWATQNSRWCSSGRPSSSTYRFQLSIAALFSSLQRRARSSASVATRPRSQACEILIPSSRASARWALSSETFVARRADLRIWCGAFMRIVYAHSLCSARYRSFALVKL